MTAPGERLKKFIYTHARHERHDQDLAVAQGGQVVGQADEESDHSKPMSAAEQERVEQDAAPSFAAPAAPDLPSGLGSRAHDLRPHLDQLLREADGQLGEIASLMLDGDVDANAPLRDFVDRSSAANVGAVSNLRATIRAVRQAKLPNAPSVARQAAAKVRALQATARDNGDDVVVAYLEELEAKLEARVQDRVANAAEVQQLERDSEYLAASVEGHGGVYVYTYPTYHRHARHDLDNPPRHLLKIGYTTKSSDERVLAQARAAGIPEDPVILRVYRHRSEEPWTLEKRFHRLLWAAGHVHPDAERRIGGKEWFATTEDFLDAIAEELGALIEQPDLEQES